jgi:hypothetical protein
MGIDPIISLRITFILRPGTLGRMGIDPIISLRFTLLLPRVIGVMTSDYSNG